MKVQRSKTKDKSNLSIEGLEQIFLPQRASSSSAETNENLLVRPEMHMFLRPYFLLDKHADRFAGIEINEVVTVNGKKIERRWCVRPDERYGMPGSLDRDVLLALYEIAYERYLLRGYLVPELMPIGTIRSFVQRLGLTYSGRTATAVKQSLKRLVHTTCKSDNSFFDKSRNLFVTEAFQLLRSVGIAGESDGNGGVIEESFVVFDDRIRSNLNARYLMVIDLIFMRGLKSEIVKHLYPLLSHWLWRTAQDGYWRVEYKWLAEHLGIKVWDKLWRAKQQLESANTELKDKKFIADYQWDGWYLVYFPGEAFNAEQERRSVARANASEPATVKPHTEASASTDKLLPILSLYAQGLPMADALLSQRGLTKEQAQALCIERGIKLLRTD